MCQLSTNIKNSDKTSLKTINKIFANIKQNHCCVRYQKLGNESHLHIVIYSDAAHGNLPNGGVKVAMLFSFVVVIECVHH